MQKTTSKSDWDVCFKSQKKENKKEKKKENIDPAKDHRMSDQSTKT